MRNLLSTGLADTGCPCLVLVPNFLFSTYCAVLPPLVHVESRLLIFTDLATPVLFGTRSNTCGHVFRTCDHEFRRDLRKEFPTRVSIWCIFTVKIRGTPIEQTAGAKLRSSCHAPDYCTRATSTCKSGGFKPVSQQNCFSNKFWQNHQNQNRFWAVRNHFARAGEFLLQN